MKELHGGGGLRPPDQPARADRQRLREWPPAGGLIEREGQISLLEEVLAKVTVTDALAAFGHDTPRRNVVRCPLPGHEDSRASTGIYRKDGRERWWCHACNTGGDVIDLIRLTLNVEPVKATRILAREFGILMAEEKPSKKYRMTKPDPGPADPRKRKHTEEGPLVKVGAYHYLDADGKPLFDVLRYEPKTFRQRPVDASGNPLEGEKKWDMTGVKRVLYRLPEVTYAVEKGLTIYVVEGERDVLAAMEAGLVATTNPGGAGKWRPEYSESLRGAHVVIVADRDRPSEAHPGGAGQEHARTVAAALEGIAASVELLESATAKDLRDHLESGFPIDALRALTVPTSKRKKFSLAV